MNGGGRKTGFRSEKNEGRGESGSDGGSTSGRISAPNSFGDKAGGGEVVGKRRENSEA